MLNFLLPIIIFELAVLLFQGYKMYRVQSASLMLLNQIKGELLPAPPKPGPAVALDVILGKPVNQ